MKSTLTHFVLLLTVLLGACLDERNTREGISTHFAAIAGETCGADAPKDANGCYAFTLTATKTYGPSTWYGDARCLCRPMRFPWPAHIDVTAGNAGNHWTDVFFIDAETEKTEYCRYKGGSSQSHPSGSTQIALGLKYKFQFCTNGQVIGDIANVTYLRLYIANGDSWLPRTEVTLPLVELGSACASDAADPALTITAPPAGDIYHSPVWLEGTVTDQGPVRVYAGGMEARVHAGKYLVGPLTLTEGANSIDVIAEDARGHQVTLNRSFNFLSGGVPVPADQVGVNQAPLFSNSPAARVALVGSAFEFDADHVDPDPGDTASYALISPAPSGSISINSATGLFSFTPTLSEVGLHDIILRVTDAGGLQAELPFRLRVARPNQAPVLSTTTPPTAATLETPYTYDFDGIDPDPGTSLVYSLVQGPAGMRINSGTGLLSWTRNSTQAGVHQITVLLSDQSGACTPFTFFVTAGLSNTAPAITSSPLTTATQGALYSYQVVASDPDPSTVLSYQLDVAPEDMVIDSAGLITWYPTNAQVGDQPVTIRVTDNGGLYGVQSFVIAVANVNDPPSIVSAPVTGATIGEPYAYQVVAEDPDQGDILVMTLESGPVGLEISSSGLLSWTPQAGQVGDHSVTLRVTDAAFAFSEQSYVLTVVAANTAPIIVSEPVLSATEDQTYAYQVTATDSPGDILSYSLDLAPSSMSIDLLGLVSWLPDNDDVGPHQVSIRVTDQGGAYDVQSYTLTVANVNDAPRIISSAVTTATQDQAYAYQVAAEDDDVGDILSFELVTAPSGMSISASGLIAWTPTNDDLGDHSVTVRVTDYADAADTQSFSISVQNVNDPPVITSAPALAAAVGIEYLYDVVGSDPDPNDTLSYSLLEAPSGMSIHSSSGRITWTAAQEDIGPNAVTVRVADAAGAFASQSFSVEVTGENRPPVITSTAPATGTQGVLYSYTVVATDPDVGDTLSFALDVAPAGMSIDTTTGLLSWTPTNAQVGENAATVRATDGEGLAAFQSFVVVVANVNDPPEITSTPPTTASERALLVYLVTASDPDLGEVLTFSLAAAPTGATIGAQSGLLEWTPSPTQLGVQSFSVRVTDAAGATATQAFEVSVANVNDRPEITSAPVTAATQGQAYSYLVVATDPDAGDTLSYALDLAPAGMSIDAASGGVSWTPSSTQVGGFDVRIRVADQQGASATQSYRVEVEDVNDPPAFTSTAPTVATEGLVYVYLAKARDPDAADVLTYSVVTGPAGLVIDSATGRVSWTPASSQIGGNPVTLRVADGGGLSATQSFTITVLNVNDAPVFMSQPPVTAVQHQLYTYAPVVFDPDVPETLSFELDLAPPGMAIDPETGEITWRPGPRQVGDFGVMLLVYDQAGALDLQSFTITVLDVNDAPSFISAPVLSAVENTRYAYAAIAVDPDAGARITYSAPLGPPGLRVDGVTGAVSWVPGTSQIGAHAVVIRATDEIGAIADQNYTITVTANAAPCGPSSPEARCASMGWAHVLGTDGRPLGGALVEEDGPDGTRVSSSDPSSGLAALGGGSSGDYRWTFRVFGRVPTFSDVALSAQAVTWVPAPKLAPLVDLFGPIFPEGSSFEDVDGRIELSFPPDAVVAGGLLAAAVLDGQSLPKALPLGYSPAGAIWYEVDGVLNAPPTARFRLPAPLSPGATLVLASFDEITRAWIAEAQVTAPALPTPFPEFDIELGLPGGYALLLPDPATPTTVLGQPLVPSTVVPPAVAELLAAGEVTPAVQVASDRVEDVTGIAEVRLAHGGAPPLTLPSGIVLPARLFERYIRPDHTETELAFVDLAVAFHRYPPVRPRLGAPTFAGLVARFPVRPRFMLPVEELVDVEQRIDVLSELSFVGAALDGAGGSLASGGVQVSLPSGALSEPALITLSTLSPDAMSLAGQSAAAAFTLDWSGAPLAAMNRASVDVSNLAPNRYYVLAERTVSEVESGYAPVERFLTDAAGQLLSLEPAGPDRLPGLTRGGAYGLFEVQVAQGLVRGVVERGSGSPVSGAIVTAEGTPWRIATDATGRFALVAPPGEVSASATQKSSGENGSAVGTLATATDTLDLVIVIGAQAPRIVRTSPSAGATAVPVLSPIEVSFSEPIASPSVLADAITVRVGGELIPGSVTLRAAFGQQRRMLRFLASRPLPYSSLIEVEVSAAITDLDGLAIDGTRTFAFTTAAVPARYAGGPRLTSYAPGSQLTPCAPYDPEVVGPDFDPTGLSVGVPGFDAADPTITCVVGSRGVSDPNVPVVLINEDRGTTSTVLSLGNGSFKGFLRGAEEELLTAVLVNQNGTQLVVPLDMQKFDDGTVALYAGGGVVSAPNPFGPAPLELVIEPGAITRRVKIKMEARTAAESLSAAQDVAPEDGTISFGVAVAYDGPPLAKPADIRFPVDASSLNLPSGTSPEDVQFMLLQPRLLDVEGEGFQVYETIDKVEYEQGALVTRSFPFLGMLFAAAAKEAVRVFTIIWANSKPTPVNGYAVACEAAYDDADLLVGCLEDGVVPVRNQVYDVIPSGRRLPGAVIFAENQTGGSQASTPGRLRVGQSVSVAGLDGRYAMAIPSLGNTHYSIRAQHPEFPGQRPSTPYDLATSILGGQPRAYASVIFATRDVTGFAPQGPQVSVAHTPERPGAYPGTDPSQAPIAQRARIRVVAQHGSEVPTGIRLAVSSLTPLVFGETVSAGEIFGLGSPVSTATSSSENKLVREFDVTSKKAVLMRLEVVAETSEGTTKVLYPIYFGASVPPPPSETPPPDPNDRVGPYVVQSWPIAGSLAADTGAPIVISFSEPVDSRVLVDLAGVTLSPDAGPPVARLDSTRTQLELVYPNLAPGTDYTLSLSSEVRDLASNALDQDPLDPGNQSFVLRFRTRTQVGTAVGDAFTEVQFGGGAEVYGIHAFVLDRSAGAMHIYDLSNPRSPRRVSTVIIADGYPRDLELIPRYSYVRPLGDARQSPCGLLHPAEVPWSQGFTSSTAVSRGCASLDRTVVAVVGGLLRPHLAAGVASGGSQYLRVFDVTDVQNVVTINQARITDDPSAVVGQLRWSPPSLSYVERSETNHTVNAVHLQAFLLGLDLSAEQYRTMPVTFLGSPGLDLNGDGDFVDPNEILPLPSRPFGGLVDLGFAGKRLTVYPEGTSQTVFDYAFSGRRGFVGAALGVGRAIDELGTPGAFLTPAYRTLASGGTFLAGPIRDQTTITYEGRDVRAVGFFPDQPLRIREGAEQTQITQGVVQVIDLGLVGVLDRTTSQNRIFLYDFTNPLAPQVLGDPEGLLLPPDQGFVSAFDLDPVYPNRLRVRTGDSLIHLDLDLLTMSNPSEDGTGASHPSLVSVIRGVGTTLASAGVSDYGVYARSSEKQVVFTGPQLSFVSFPNAAVPAGTGSSGLVFPDDVRLALSTGDRAKAERMLARLSTHDVLRLSTAKTAGSVKSDLTPPNPVSHYFVLMRAPGSAGAEVPILLEATNDAGALVPHAGADLAPSLAASARTVSDLGRAGLSHAARVPGLVAKRLSDDPSSPHYNVYLGGPFVLTYQALTQAERTPLEDVSGKPRYLLFSSAGLRASVDPSLSGPNNPLLAFRSLTESGESRPRVGSAAQAKTFDVHRALGPNPAPVVGSHRARGSSGLVAAHNGEMTIEREDLSLPTRRGALSFVRSYRGQDRLPGPLGLGWSHGFNQRVSELRPEMAPPSGATAKKLMLVDRGQDTSGGDTVLGENDLVFHDGSGNAIHYRAHPDGVLPESYSEDPVISPWAPSILRVYTPERGIYDAMVKMKSGHLVRVMPDGHQYWFGPTGRLEKIYDRFESNWQQLVYTQHGELRAIVDKSVEQKRQFELGYYRGSKDEPFTPGLDERTAQLAKAGLLRRLKDSAGREVLYSYDAHNRLVMVEEDMGGGQTRRLEYGYDDKDRLHTVVDGSVTGRPLVSADGYMEEDGRVLRVFGAEGETGLTYAHDNLASALGAGSRTTILLADFAREILEFNRLGLVEDLRADGPSSGEEHTTFEYAADVDLIRLSAPRGRVTDYKYERDVEGGLMALRSQGNVREIVRSAGGSGQLPTERAQFDRHYNLASGEQQDAYGRTRTVALTQGGRSIASVMQGSESTNYATDAITGELMGRSGTRGVDFAYQRDSTTGFITNATVGDVSTSYTYDGCPVGEGLGLPCTASRLGSDKESFGYSKAGLMETYSKGASNTGYRYNAFGDVERVEESLEEGKFRVETFTYDDLGQVESRTQEAVETFNAPGGEPLTWSYPRDARARVERVQAPGGTEIGIEYDHQGRPRSRTVGAYVEEYFYDADGNLERQTIGDAETKWKHDGLGRLERITDAEGGQLELSYHDNGDLRRTSVEDVDYGTLSVVEHQVRDAVGRPSGFRMAERADASYSMSFSGRTSNVSGPLGLDLQTTTDNAGRLSTQSQAGVYASTRGYDSAGRLETMSHVVGGQDYGGSYSYNGLDHLQEAKDSAGATRASYTTRLDGAVTQVISDPGPGGLGLRTDIGRSVLGEALSERKQNGVTTEVKLDGQRRLGFVGLESGEGRTYEYDTEEHLLGVTYRDGSQMSFSNFDARNMPQTITLPGSGSMTLAYDKLGRPKSLATQFPAAGVPGGSVTSQETAKFDALDRVRAQTFDAGSMTFDYDLLGVMTKTTLTYQGRTYSWRNTPNAAGSTQETTYPSGQRISLGRDVGQRLRSMKDVSSSPSGADITKDTTYATPTKPGFMKLGPSGLVREDVYDTRQRLEKRIYRTATEIVAEIRYLFDGADREVARQYSHRGHRTDHYVYDEGGRLVRADLASRLIDPSNLPLTPAVYGWDVSPSVAPQVSSGTFSFGDVLREYGFDLTGKDYLTSALSTTYDGPAAPPAVPSIASTFTGEDGLGFLTEVDGFTRTRDALGNATRIETQAPGLLSPKSPLDLVFDAHSRLRRATRSDGVAVEYEYRADGVLLSRKLSCGATPPIGCTNTTRLYLYDGMVLLEEWELGTSASQDVLMARYYYAEEGDIPVAGDFRMGPGPNGLVRYYFVVDRQGSVLGLVDEGGAWVERVRYDVWGAPVFEAADVMAPEVSRVGTDPGTGDVVIVMSEPVVPRAVLPTAPNQNVALEAIDLSSEVYFEDALGQEVPGQIVVDLDATDEPGVPVGSVLRFIPDSTVLPGTQLVLRLNQGALVDDGNLGNADTSLAVTYGAGVSYTGPPAGSTQAVLHAQSLTGNRLLFQSHFWDADVGLYHMRARMFDPRSGMFLSRDPSGYVDSVNLWAPMKWDVVNHRDPTGEAVFITEDEPDAPLPPGHTYVFRSGLIAGMYEYWNWIQVDETGRQIGEHVRMLTESVDFWRARASGDEDVTRRLVASAQQVNRDMKGRLEAGLTPSAARRAQNEFDAQVSREIIGAFAFAFGGMSPGAKPQSSRPRVARAIPPPGVPIPGARRLTPTEQATAGRLMGQRPGLRLRESPHRGAEYVDQFGRSYDALGSPRAAQYWNPQNFERSIRKHLLKSNDFTVVDLTGLSPTQIAEVERILAGLDARELARLIVLGR